MTRSEHVNFWFNTMSNAVVRDLRNGTWGLCFQLHRRGKKEMKGRDFWRFGVKGCMDT